jgi:hypothetical protein
MNNDLTCDEDLVRRLPLPLAQVYRRAHNAETSLVRHQVAYYLWEAALKLLGSVAVASYAECGTHHTHLAERLKKLARPSIGNWWEFVKDLVPVLAAAEEGTFVDLEKVLLKGKGIPLPEAARLDATLRGRTEGRGSSEIVRLHELFGQLVTYRNKELGHGVSGAKTEKHYDRMGRQLLLALTELLDRVDVLAGRRLVYISSVHRASSGAWLVEAYELTGETARRMEPFNLRGNEAGGLPVPQQIYLYQQAAAPAEADAPRPPLALRCSLHPLLIYDKDARKVFFLNAQPDDQRVEYLDYVDGGSMIDREELADAQRELMARVLGIPVDPCAAGEWAKIARDEERKALAGQESSLATNPAPTKASLKGSSSPETPAAVAPSAPTPTAPESVAKKAGSPLQALETKMQIALLYKRHAQPDEHLLKWLEKDFLARGYQVFVDRHMSIGVEWAKELEKRVRESDFVVVLLSEGAVHSEMLAYEIQIARDEAQKRNGKPQLLPVRVNFEAGLPPEMADILDRLQYFLWKGPHDNDRLMAELLHAFHHPPPLKKIPPPSGVMPLDSQFYVVRPTDQEFQAAIARQDSVVLLRGARQMGKTSLLARGLHQARKAGARIVMTDLQKLNSSDLESVEKFFRTLGEWIADELDLQVFPGDVWENRRGPSVNFERYLRREVLGKIEEPLVWAIDEADRLFTCPFGSEVFGLFRSWHNARVLEPTLHWSRLTLAIAYATEAHLFITDMNQSPFNVGTLLALEDFTQSQINDLNDRYRSPLRTEEERRRYFELLGGHPYLSNRGMYQMVQGGLSLDAFQALADRDEGVFGDHLRRILVLLARDPELCEEVRGVLHGRPCSSAESFYRLRSAGVMGGESARDMRLRCRLYASYLERHLL